MNKRALIFGISGQDGSYLAPYLITLGYKVYGVIRRNSVTENQHRIRVSLDVVTSTYLIQHIHMDFYWYIPDISTKFDCVFLHKDNISYYMLSG